MPINTQLLVAVSLLASIPAGYYFVQPRLVDAVIAQYSLSMAQAGELPGRFFVGYTLSAGLAIWWVQHWSWRHMTVVGLLAFAGGLTLAGFANNLEAILAYYVLAGVGGGILYTVPMCVIASTDTHYRGFGFRLAAEQLVGIVLLLLLSYWVIQAWGLKGASLTLALLAVFVLPFTPRIPSSMAPQSAAQNVDVKRRILNWASVTGLTLFAVFFAGYSGLYAFLGQLAASADTSAEASGTLLAIGVAVGGAAAFSLPFLLRWVPGQRLMGVAIASCLLAAALFSIDIGSSQYALGVLIWMGSTMIIIALYMAMLVDIEPGPRFAAAMAPTIGIGSLMGPIAAGAIADTQGLTAMVVVTTAAMLVAVVGLLVIHTIRAEQQDL